MQGDTTPGDNAERKWMQDDLERALRTRKIGFPDWDERLKAVSRMAFVPPKYRTPIIPKHLREMDDKLRRLIEAGRGPLWKMVQEYKTPSWRKQLLDGMEITNAMCDGRPVTIAVPKAVNHSYAAKPIEIGEIRKDPPKPPAQPEVVKKTPGGIVGEHARRYVKEDEIDWENRILVFKGKHHPRLQVPASSNKVWDYMKRLLASDDPQGWVKLTKKGDSRWSSHFDRYDTNDCIDAKHVLTKLRCRIESSRKRGRLRQEEAEKGTVPMIRLTAFDKEQYDGYVKCQKAKRARRQKQQNQLQNIR